MSASFPKGRVVYDYVSADNAKSRPQEQPAMTELIDNPPPLPDHKHSLNSGSFAPLYTADQYRAGEAAAFARGVAAGRNAGLEEAVKALKQHGYSEGAIDAIRSLKR